MPGLVDVLPPPTPTDLDGRYEKAVDIITHAAVAFLYERDFSRSIDCILARTGRGLGADRAVLVELAEGRPTLHGAWPSASGGAVAELVGLIGAVPRWHALLAQGTSLAVTPADLATDEQALMARLGIAALAVAPVLLDGRYWGILLAAAPVPRLWSNIERKALLGVAAAISAALLVRRGEQTLREAKKRVEHGMEATIYALVTTIESRDPYTAGHQRRVARLAAAAAIQLGLSAFEVRGIYTAGVIHDIGKIYVPSEILTRPGRLTPEEFDLIKCHSRIGYDIASQVDFPWPVAAMIRQHHEKLDGSGYPDHLMAPDILLGSRILCVADVIEAMATHRPYRPSLGIAAALDEVTRNQGRLYDPDAVAACTKVLGTDGFEL